MTKTQRNFGTRAREGRERERERKREKTTYSRYTKCQTIIIDTM